MGKNICKVRGFRLNLNNSLQIHFDEMKEIITHNRTKTIETQSSKILINKYTHTLYNRKTKTHTHTKKTKTKKKKKQKKKQQQQTNK